MSRWPISRVGTEAERADERGRKRRSGVQDRQSRQRKKGQTLPKLVAFESGGVEEEKRK